MLALVPLVLGYVTIPATPDASVIFRWDMPANFNDNEGLGDGLTYAEEPDFCAKMIPHFSDRSWITCSNIQSAIRRAFESWAANHQMISFTNVSSLCAADATVRSCEQANAVTCAGKDGVERIECIRQRGNCTKLCGSAEIFLLAEEVFNGRLVDTIAYVEHWDQLGQTAAESVGVFERGVRMTNGIISTRDAIIKKATITFMRHECYYLDSTFCASLHKTERDFGSVLVLYALFTMPFFALAIVLLTARFCISLRVMLKHKRGWALGLRDAVKSLAEPLTEIWVVLFLVALMPFLYFSLAKPCMSCYDFEASMAHEVGLVLGLAQPDVEGNANFAVTMPLNATNCGANAALLPGELGALAAPAPLPTERSMMDVLLTRDVAPCPTTDDLQGLNMLYPTCGMARQTEPLCYKSFENLGVLRLMSSVGLAVAISFLVAACLSRGSQLFEKVLLRLRELHREVDEARKAAAINIQARWRGNKARIGVHQLESEVNESKRNLLAGDGACAVSAWQQSMGAAGAPQQGSAPAGDVASAALTVMTPRKLELPTPKQVTRI